MSHLPPSLKGRPYLGGPGLLATGGAKFRKGGGARSWWSGRGVAGRMGVAWGSPALSRLDNALEPPDRRAPAPP